MIKKNIYLDFGFKQIKKETLTTFFLTICYKFLLDYCFVNFVVPYYGYMGFYVQFDLFKFILSSLSIILVFFVLKINSKVSSIFIYIHFIIMIIPMATIVSFMDESLTFYFMCLFVFILEAILLRVIPDIKFKNRVNLKKIINLILISISCIVFLYLLLSKGIPNFAALNFNSVYEIRKDVQFSGLIAYLISWQAKVINPMLIGEGFKKSKIKMSIGILLQFLLFLYTGHKSYLFTIFGVIAIMYVYEKCKVNNINFCNLFIKLFLYAILLTAILAATTIGLYLISYFIRRLLIVPADIKFNYYDYFQTNDFLYYSESIISKIFGLKSQLDEPLPNIIGLIYNGDPEIYANTGYLGDAYANGGFFGMIINSFIFVAVLKLFDSYAVFLKSSFVLGVAAFIIIGLNDTSLLTSLMTGGLFLLLVLLYIMSISKSKD